MAPFKRLSTLVAPCYSIKIPGFGLCLCSWPLLGLCACPQRTASVAPKRERGPRLRNPDLETKAANVWDLVQSDE